MKIFKSNQRNVAACWLEYSDKIHGFLHSLLQDLLDLDPLRLGEPHAAGAAGAGAAAVRPGEVVVMLPGPVSHQVGVVGGGGVGDRPGQSSPCRGCTDCCSYLVHRLYR